MRPKSLTLGTLEGQHRWTHIQWPRYPHTGPIKATPFNKICLAPFHVESMGPDTVMSTFSDYSPPNTHMVLIRTNPHSQCLALMTIPRGTPCFLIWYPKCPDPCTAALTGQLKLGFLWATIYDLACAQISPVKAIWFPYLAWYMRSYN